MSHSANWLLDWLLNLEGGDNTSIESAVNFYQTKRLNIPENNTLHIRRRENRKSHMRVL